ncbi:MAG: DNA repair protein RecN [Alphaproteobacteria bacterium]|nr:DNA repair protein RecN [Alphaproteobacteria bacterium]
MLNALSIRNVVLIDDLHLDFEKGLCVLTGETGAGKSILLDALGLALGARAETRLLRQGAKKAEVTACFSLLVDHPLWSELEEHGIPYDDLQIIFRRHLDEEGKSKCFLNDQLISQTLMRRLGQQLVEIHGQFDQLLDAKAHMAAIDAYGKIDKDPIQTAFKDYQAAKKALHDFHEKMAQSFERQTFLRFAIEEMEKAAPRQGEEETLESEKSLIAHRAKIADALSTVEENVNAVLTGLFHSHKALTRVQDYLPEKINPLLEAADRAILETQEIFEGMSTLTREVQGTQQSLESLENRLHSLRSLCRKYKTQDLLSSLLEFKAELSALEQGENHIDALERTVLCLKDAYLEKAQALSESRKKAALALETALSQELPPLKLEHAKFRVKVEELAEKGWGAAGIDHIEFYTQMNPGSPEGPLATIVSGGELSRLMLALKVVLTQSGAVPTLIFDEIESGTGGAVAAAMGERLKVLSQNLQLLAITHSPQIAGHGAQHLVVFKVMQSGTTTTHVKALTHEERLEEVARMLAGEEITEEARAAAKRLMRR